MEKWLKEVIEDLIQDDVLSFENKFDEELIEFFEGIFPDSKEVEEEIMRKKIVEYYAEYYSKLSVNDLISEIKNNESIFLKHEKKLKTLIEVFYKNKWEIMEKKDFKKVKTVPNDIEGKYYQLRNQKIYSVVGSNAFFKLSKEKDLLFFGYFQDEEGLKRYIRKNQ